MERPPLRRADAACLTRRLRHRPHTLRLTPCSLLSPRYGTPLRRQGTRNGYPALTPSRMCQRSDREPRAGTGARGLVEHYQH
jgi:hypothetical protein